MNLRDLRVGARLGGGAARVEEAAAAASSLQEQAGGLMQVVGVFHLAGARA